MKNKLIIILVILIGIAGTLGIINIIDNNKEVAGISTENKPIRGLILPHHKLADELIQSTLSKITSSYSYVVIFGPNHFKPHSPTLITADTLEGAVVADDVVQKLNNKFSDIPIENQLVANDHSIMLHVPYFQNKFPKANIIPFIVSPYFNEKDIDNKIRYLSSILPSDTLFIASIDFSHNLMMEEALEKNKESISAIKSFNYTKLYEFKDDHVDSGIAVALLLKSMQVRQKTTWETWNSSHAALITGDATVQGTSYVIGVFR